MPANVRIVHANDFIVATPEGKLDLARSRELLLQVAAASAHLVAYDVVLDTRNARSELTVPDLWHLASTLSDSFRKAFSRPLKTAVLCPADRFDQAGFFALCAENRGFHVQAFTSVADAYEWLIGTGAGV